MSLEWKVTDAKVKFIEARKYNYNLVISLIDYNNSNYTVTTSIKTPKNTLAVSKTYMAKDLEDAQKYISNTQIEFERFIYNTYGKKH